MATEYMVAQQYLSILSNLMAKRDGSKVVLLPSKTIGDIKHIVLFLEQTRLFSHDSRFIYLFSFRGVRHSEGYGAVHHGIGNVDFCIPGQTLL